MYVYTIYAHKITKDALHNINMLLIRLSLSTIFL